MLESTDPIHRRVPEKTAAGEGQRGPEGFFSPAFTTEKPEVEVCPHFPSASLSKAHSLMWCWRTINRH